MAMSATTSPDSPASHRNFDFGAFTNSRSRSMPLPVILAFNRVFMADAEGTLKLSILP